ncbi:MAG TPA: trypsin-like peptidase domain-containing protein [Gemmataceae bacterium]
MHRNHSIPTPTRLATLAAVAALALVAAARLPADPSVLERSQKQRVAVIQKVSPSVVAVFARGGRGGGSGVIIDPRGYALTNFHVVAGAGNVMQCGLSDGVLYDAVIVGTDKVGDVALIKLLPREEGKPFPFAPLGDSDKVRPGDWSLAMGNPFLLATDFTPTVTYGLVSGVHRYQYPEGRGLLEYTDCIQIDTSINPGNSGGPLFNMAGEVIGINGRGSFDKRGRVNSGVGYAISINQIKNFLGHLYAGLDADHATLGVLVETKSEEADVEQMVVTQLLEEADAVRRGLDIDDELVRFAGRPVTSVNQYKNILGIFPKGWRVPLEYRRGNERKEILVRLMGNIVQQPQQQPPQKGPRPRPSPEPERDSPAAKLYKPKRGFANFYFNEVEQKRLLEASRKHGDFAALGGDWKLEGTYEMADRSGAMKAEILPAKGEGADDAKTVVNLTLNIGYTLQPLAPGQTVAELVEPIGSGGLMMALYQWRRLLVKGPSGFEGDFYHGGHEPFYPMPLSGPAPKSYAELRVDAEVLHTEHAAVKAKWYFSREDQRLLGGEVYVTEEGDPCEVYFHDYKDVQGRKLPHKIEVRHGDKRYAVLTVTGYQLAEGGK